MTAPNPSIPRLGGWHASRLTKTTQLTPKDFALRGGQAEQADYPLRDHASNDLDISTAFDAPLP